MSFASPGYLLLLGLLPLLGYYIFRFGRRQEPSLGYSLLAPLGELSDSSSAFYRSLIGILRLSALFLLIIALARPQQGLKSGARDIFAADIMLCLDVSESMQAEDFPSKTRLQMAREAAGKFIERRKWDRIGLALFGRFAMTQCPLTTDHGALAGLLDKVKIGTVPGDRTAVGDGLATCVERLKNSKAKSKVIILLTDGANNAGSVDPVTGANLAASFGIKIYSIGAGSPQGGYATYSDPIFGTRRIKVADSLDEPTLTKVAGITGGEYFRATDKDSLFRTFAEIDRLEKTEIKVDEFTEYLERFEWLLLPGLLALGLELLIGAVFFRRIP